MTTSELFAWGLPAVLVPLPTAAADHQTHNARALADAGAAIHVPQRELSVERLDAIGAELRAEPRRRELAERAAARGRPDAAARIAARVLESVAGAPI